jgi:hypothetical protein
MSSDPGHYVTATAAYEGADKGADDGADEEASSIFACRIARKALSQTRAIQTRANAARNRAAQRIDETDLFAGKTMMPSESLRPA